MKSKIKSVFLAACVLAIAGSITSSCNSDSGKKSNSDSTTTTSTNGDDNTLLGAGSTFVYPLFSKQFSEYNKVTGLKINYQSIGSGGGILQLTNKTVDFGDSDAPLNDEQSLPPLWL